jgi:signal transduction histidine kinase
MQGLQAMQTNVVIRTPHILIVDDHPAMRTGIRLLLASRPEWHVCGEAVDGIDAVEKVNQLKPDVVLMDVSMPRMDGLTAMRIIQRKAPRSRVIIVTQDDVATMTHRGIRADGYVLKINLDRDLIRAIDRVLQPEPDGSHEELERRNAEIVEQSEALRELSNRLQRGQDAERRRIARELHDSAGQLLAVLRLNLGQVRGHIQADETATRALEQSEQLLEQLDKEIRTMSYLLHPPLLDESGLSGAIRWYARGLAEGGLVVDLDVPIEFGRLPPEMELALFRIVQECLTNIRCHSGSKTAAIHLTRDGDSVRMDVQDEGRGMSHDQITGRRAGVGITGMQERVRHFGGTLDIESGDRGTKVSVIIPVPEDFPSGT